MPRWQPIEPESSRTMRARGRLKWFSEQKGYGFITIDDGSDCFVHRSAFEAEGLDALKEGDPLEFDVVESPRGSAAEDVVCLLALVENEEKGERDEENEGEWEEEVTEGIHREQGNEVWE